MKKYEIDKKVKNMIFILCGICISGYTILYAHWNWTIDGDKVPQTYGVFSAVARAINQGEISLWNPYLFGGIPAVGSPISQALYPINWILCTLFWNKEAETLSYAIIPVNILLHISIYYIALYMIMKKMRLSSFSSAILCTLSICSFSFSMFEEWIVFFDGFCWFPSIVLLTINLLESKKKVKIKYVLELAFIFAIEASISVSVMLVMCVFFIGILLFIYIIGKPLKEGIYSILKVASAGILGMLLSAPAILCTISFLINGARYVPDVGWIYGLGEMVPISAFKGNTCTAFDLEAVVKFLPIKSRLSIGGFLLTLVILGILKKENKYRNIYIYSIVGLIFSGLYCMGYLVPDIIYYVPFLNNLRETYMYAPFANFFVMILAANGTVVLEELILRKCDWKDQIAYPKIFILALFFFIVFNNVPHIVNKEIILYSILISALIVFLIFAKRNIFFRYGLIAIALICVSFNYWLYYRTLNLSAYSEKDILTKVNVVNETNKELITGLDDGSFFRIYGIESYPQNSGSSVGFYETSGYHNPTTKISISQMEKISLPKRVQLQNIKYIFLPRDHENEIQNLGTEVRRIERKFEGYTSYDSNELEDIYVYETRNCLGGAWCVNDYVLYNADEEDEIVGIINAQETNLAEIVYVNENECSGKIGTELEKIDKGKRNEYIIESIEYSPNFIKYTVNSQNDSILVTSEYFYPGWMAFVDGEKTVILNVDYSNRGVIIPEGTSVVEFRYFPIEFFGGALLQIVTIILLIIIFVLKRYLRFKRGV